MIYRKFAYKEHEEYGDMGWEPMWFGEADPVQGMGVAHDIFEHFPHDEGGAEGEFMALGASYYIRGQTGWFSGRSTPEENYAGDFPEIFGNVTHEGQTLRDSGVTRAIPDVDEGLRTIVAKGVRLARSERPDVMAGLPRDATQRVLGWLRKGYRGAIRRYGNVAPGMGAYEISHLFTQIQREADRLLKHAQEGDELHVKVNIRRMEVNCYVKNPWDDEHYD